MSEQVNRFSGPLALQQIGEEQGRPVYTLLRPLTFICPPHPPYNWVRGSSITAPAGFVTDLASVPRIPLVYWLAGGRANHAAVIHDYCYRTRPMYRFFARAETEREFYDDIFDLAMQVSQPDFGITPVRQPFRSLMYAGVRLGGSLQERRERGLQLAKAHQDRAVSALLAQRPPEAP